MVLEIVFVDIYFVRGTRRIISSYDPTQLSSSVRVSMCVFMFNAMSRRVWPLNNDSIILPGSVAVPTSLEVVVRLRTRIISVGGRIAVGLCFLTICHDLHRWLQRARGNIGKLSCCRRIADVNNSQPIAGGQMAGRFASVRCFGPICWALPHSLPEGENFFGLLHGLGFASFDVDIAAA